jgi:hypothetical protein
LKSNDRETRIGPTPCELGQPGERWLATHTGISVGGFSVKNCRAHFDDLENAYRLIFVFKGSKAARIEQVNDCLMFGTNVEARGNYTKQ